LRVGARQRINASAPIARTPLAPETPEVWYPSESWPALLHGRCRKSKQLFWKCRWLISLELCLSKRYAMVSFEARVRQCAMSDTVNVRRQG